MINLKSLTMLLATFTLAVTTVWAEEPADVQKIRKEIASPLSGEFSQASEAMNWGSMQEDIGGMSGNSNGMDGFETAEGDPTPFATNTPSY